MTYSFGGAITAGAWTAFTTGHLGFWFGFFGSAGFPLLKSLLIFLVAGSTLEGGLELTTNCEDTSVLFSGSVFVKIF